MTLRKLSLRARLLAGLLAVTAVFLIVMGVVSSTVLGRMESGQFDNNLLLTARGTSMQIANASGGYVAARCYVLSGSVTMLTPPSDSGQELEAFLTRLLDGGNASRFLTARSGKVFNIDLKGYPPLHATVREWRFSRTVLPVRGFVVVARPLSAAGSQVRGLVLAELATGAGLLGLLALAGRWLIVRGLAPLDRMASTAYLITRQGDLTARMPDLGDRHEVDRLAAAINTMLDRIQQAFGARLRSEQKVRKFAADASHELRTPLTTIRGYAELYRQGALGPDELPNAMRRIEQEAERMSSLVAELLELARLDHTSSLNLTEVDLAELVTDAVADAKAVEPNRPIQAEAPPSLRATADEPRIRQVLANLLGNVRAHTPPGTPTTVRLNPAFDGALLEVADTGPGMSPQDAAHAFDRFHRGHRNGDGNGELGGSGLGLSIVQAIAAAHGGHARLLSSAGAGVTVQVWIPLKTQLTERDMTIPPEPLAPLDAETKTLT